MARLEEIKTEIASIEAFIRGGGTASTDGGRRAAIAAAQKARWAKIKKGSRKTSSTDGTHRRKGMSAAARKAVAERMRKYWAERRKAKAGSNK